MNEKNLKQLINELLSENASQKEAEELALFSKNLSNLLGLERKQALKDKFLEKDKIAVEKGYFQKKYAFAFLFSILLLLGFSSFVNAQKSLPGEPLYPLKIASENFVSAVHPSFKNEIVKRRSEEIRDLSGKNENSHLNEAIKEYEKGLNSNKKINLDNIKESESNLEEAKHGSISEQDRTDLERILIKTRERQKSIEDVKGEDTDNEKNKTEEEEDSRTELDNELKITSTPLQDLIDR